MAKNNIFSKAKAYRKEHPRVSFQDAIQRVKGKKTVSGKKKAAKPVAVRVVKRKRISGPVKVAGSATIGSLTKAKKIISNINKLERERATLRSKEMKDLYALSINAEHDKLDAIKRSLKR